MTNESGVAASHLRLVRACAAMDSSIVERLHATVETSLEWANRSLDVLIRLDDELQAGDTDQPPQSRQRLRDGVRDVMMSMQNQDVIGQAIGRAAAALEKRAATLERVAEAAGDIRADEIAEIHHAFRADDDLHRARDWDKI